MAEHPKVEALWQNIGFIQESMATGGLSTTAGHLKELNLITRDNYYEVATSGRGGSALAAMLMTSVEVRIRDNPDVYFTRFIEALRRSHLGNVADRLVQALPEDQRHSTSYNTMSNMTPPPGSTHTALINNQFSSFTNQPSSHYSIQRGQTNTSYTPSPDYLPPTQQQQPPYPHTYSSPYPHTYSSPYPQAYSSSYPHTSQHYTVPTHEHVQPYYQLHNTNTSHMYQNPSPHYQHPLITHTGYSFSPSQRPRLDYAYELDSGFSPTMGLASHRSLCLTAPPTPILYSGYQPSSMAASRIYFTTSSKRLSQNFLHQHSLPPPLSQHLSVDCEPSLLTTFNPSTTTETYYTSPALPTLAPPTPAPSTLAPPTPAPRTPAPHSPAPPTQTSTANLIYHCGQPLCMTASSSRISYTASTSGIELQHSPYNLEHGSSYEHTTLPLHSSPSNTTSSPPATTPSSSGVVSSPSTPAYQQSLSPAMQQYVKHLKNIYIRKMTPVYDKEHRLLQAQAKSFINIVLVHKKSPRYMKDSDKQEILMDRLHGNVDAILKKKTKMHISDVCKSQDGRLACSVLVEGAPGVGKTTFAYELCKCWAKGEILQKFVMVVIIKLRDLRTRRVENLEQLMYLPDTEIQQVVKEVIKWNGEGVLLILDGYDELTDSQRDTRFMQSLMSRERLCLATLMVTSRPLATRTLHDNFVQSIDQHIEVVGFTEKNIKEYIQSACGDKPELVEDFNSYLSSHPFSSALMFNPLQCAIVTDLYCSHWESGDKGFAPNTLTELYTGLVHILLLRHLTHHPDPRYRIWRIIDLNDLPEKIGQQFNAVTQLAAQGIENQQYVFDDNVPSETLGLMQKEEKLTAGSGVLVSRNFLHLTLQEYLAAVNYSQQCSSPEQLSQLLTKEDLFPLNNFLENYGKKRKKTSSSSATHWPVVLFVAGRTKLSSISPNLLSAGLSDLKHDHSVTEVNVPLVHLLYETQSPQLIQSTLVTSRKYLSISGRSALDWFVIGYCVANSTGVWKLEKKPGDKHDYLDRLILGLNLALEETRQNKGKIDSLIVNGYTIGTLKSLSQIQASYTESMTELRLLNHKSWPGKRALAELDAAVLDVSAQYPNLEVLEIAHCYDRFTVSSIAKQNNLHTLSLSCCKVSSGAIRSLIHLMQSPHCKLRTLRLRACTISWPEDTQETTILTKTDVALQSLDISWSTLDQMMSCINPFTQSLTELILHVDNYTHACTSGVETILQELPSNCPLLETFKIDSFVHISLPHSIPRFIGSQQNNLHTLLLMNCTLSSDVTRSLIHLLQYPHCKLYKLALYDCTIPTTDHTQLTTAIVSSSTITHLLFWDRNIDTPSLTALASGLKHNTTIEQLAVDKYCCNFLEDQFQVLIDAMDSSAVKRLWLFNAIFCNYKKWFSDCTLSRKNVDIEWYSDYHDLYNKW